MNLIRLNLSTCEMLTYLWLEMNLLVLIMSNLFLQVSSQPAICLFFLLLCGHVGLAATACPGTQDRRPAASQVRRRPGPTASSQPGPAAKQPARSGGLDRRQCSQGQRPGMRTNKTCIVQKKINIRAKTSI
jgi:hypothetical protein